MHNDGSVRISVGVIVYLDIDDYMDRAGDLSPSAELQLVNALQGIIIEAADGCEIYPARSFGDAILLYREELVTDALRGRVEDFLASVALALREDNVTFKAVVAAGEFIRDRELWAAGGIRLTGPLLNVAGRRLRKCRPGEIITLWPIGDAKEATYRQLSEGKVLTEKCVSTRTF